jgi:hypothetical protein
MAETRRLMCVGVWANYRLSVTANRGKMAIEECGRVQDLNEVEEVSIGSNGIET